MVNFKKLADRAKDVVEKQGGPDALKDKAGKMKQAASGKGSIGDKAKAAAAVAKDRPAGDATKVTHNAEPQSEPAKGGTTGGEPPAAQ